MSGPLEGLRVVEMPAIGPAPFCGMLLADLGADVLRLDRTADSHLGIEIDARCDLLGRGKRSLAVDLRAPQLRSLVMAILEKSDVLIEGFRPGAMEKLGLGPDVVLELNPRLIYGRMTGWGQFGPLARTAGHDINYLSLTGALHAIGRHAEAPLPPLNLVADFGGGALYMAMGILAALFERQRSGRGQVIDAAMVDGASSLMTMAYGLLAAGAWRDERGVNVLDGGAPWYDTYQCADGKFLAIGALEAKFFVRFLQSIGIDVAQFPDHMDRNRWPELRDTIARTLRMKGRDDWCSILAGSDCCVAPVLGMTEAPRHSHLVARQTFVNHGGVTQPAPAPRFSRTPGALGRVPPSRGEGGEQALMEWGVRPSIS